MNALREALLRGRRRPRLSGSGSPTLYRGDGYEFVELREYAAGDDVRRIDWAATARTGSLQTRVVLEDVALTMAAILDTSPSMQAGRSRSLANAAQEALDTWQSAATRDDRSLRVFSDEVYPHPLQSFAPFSLVQSLDVAGAVLPRGAALLVISDFWDVPDPYDLLSFLGRRFDCTALIARDPWHDALPLSGVVRMQDAETGAMQRVFIGKRERRRYAQAVAEREARLIEQFTAANWRAGLFESEEHGGNALLRAFAVR